MSGMWSVARGSTSGIVTRRRRSSARNVVRVDRRELADGDARCRRVPDDLVIDIRDVHDPVTGSPSRPGSGGSGRRTGSSGSCRRGRVRRRWGHRSTSHVRRVEWLERLERATQRVPEAERHAVTTPTRARGTDGPAGTLVARQVARGRLDRDGRHRRCPAGRRGWRASAPGGRRPDADGRPRWSGPPRQVAGRQARVASRPGAAAPDCRSRGWLLPPAGNSRPGRPAAPRTGARRTRRATRVAIRVTVEAGRLRDVQPASRRPRGCRTDGCRSPTRSGRLCRRAAHQRPDDLQVELAP